jgi:hypothetical protein
MKQVSANIPFLISQVNYLIADILLCATGWYSLPRLHRKPQVRMSRCYHPA